MIWQQNVTQIVMLTNLMEGGKVMCFMYCIPIRKMKCYFNVLNYNQTLKLLATKGDNSLPYSVVCLYTECYSKPDRI